MSTMDTQDLPECANIDSYSPKQRIYNMFGINRGQTEKDEVESSPRGDCGYTIEINNCEEDSVNQSQLSDDTNEESNYVF